ncbi:hypothetical protein HDV06_002443 [Boothiomyces sp. JEL0866]|nr:hypothetical protein HDV06_002443 [Boothiomyces sp. JEL0866]
MKPRVRVKEDLVSLVTMSWAWKLIETAAQGSLKEEDYPAVPHSSADLVNRSDKYFAQVNEYHSGIRDKLPNLYIHMAKMFIGELGGALLVKILVTVLLAVRPLAIGQLIAYLDPQTTVTLWFQEPIYTCAILIALYTLTPILDTIFKSVSLMFMVRFNAVVQSMLFEKAMRLSNKSRIIFEAGYLINVYNRDLYKVRGALNLIYEALSPLLYLVINLIVLSTVIGWIVVLSMISLVLIFIATYLLSLKVKQLTVDTNIILDSRMKIIREVIGGIRNLKISNLAGHYLDILDKSTDSYISKQSKLYIVTRLSRSTAVATSAILVSITFMAFKFSGNSIDPALVFPAYIYLNSIAEQMKEINPVLARIMNAPEGFAILSDYFCSEEIITPVTRVYKEGVAIKTINVKWKWYDADYLKKMHERRMDIVRHGKKSQVEDSELVENKDTFELGGVSLEIEQGSLIGVVGTAGSGKTTLFNGLVNELQPLEGEIYLNGKIAYATQQPWIMMDSIQSNITFGKRLDEEQLVECIQACGLVKDLNDLEDGMYTKIGENGINLSGGQKARVSLARCLYSDADIYLLDDPLAALDAYVGKQVFEQAIKKKLAKKTVLLATHQLQYMQQMDKIIVLDGGRVAEYGTFKELLNLLTLVWLNGALANSKYYFQKMAVSVTNAPLYFFEENPLGRILNRFSSDLDSLNSEMYYDVYFLITYGLSVVGNTIIICVSNKIVIVVLAASIIGIAMVQKTFDRAKLEFSRLFRLSDTPKTTLISEGISGCLTIQLFNSESFLKTKFHSLCDASVSLIHLVYANINGFELKVSLLNSVVAISIVILAVIFNEHSTLFSSLVALALTQSESSSNALARLLNYITFNKGNMNSLQRIVEYCNEIDQEPALHTLVDENLDSWPANGDITINNLDIAYHSKPDINVLKSLTVHIKGGEHIGVVGRTGSGKSTLALAFFRLIEAKAGSIDCIQACGLVKDLNDLEDGMYTKIGENGINLSGGQKARVSLARCLYSDADIYLLDDPLAALDAYVGKQVFEQAIQKKLAKKTVLLATHQLQYMQQMDKIIVLDGGRIAEYGTFKELLSKQDDLLTLVWLNGALANSKYYFQKMAVSVTNAPLYFFEENPLGRILNRFSSDLDSLNSEMYYDVYFLITYGLSVVGNTIIICVSNKIVIVVLAASIIGIAMVQKTFDMAKLELSRLFRLAESPKATLMSEGISGCLTIQLLNSELFLKTKFHSLCDASVSLIHLVYANINGFELKMNSLQRIVEYCNEIDQEQALHTLVDENLDSWPTNGDITINNLDIAYHSKPDINVLKSLTVDIKGGERVGVVGRTGSGKSTLALAFFRLIEAKAGSIVIDGVDISSIGLSKLRNNIQMISQEANVFAGSVRLNLTLESDIPDEELWVALEKVGLKDYISQLPEKLEYPLLANGSNLSVGQGQLLCLARAFAKKPKVLILDEASSSVDGEADKIIQSVIKDQLKGSTIISIAHRLNTVANFDRIMVLEQGNLVEFDSPYRLLQNPDSLFSKLVESTGDSNKSAIIEIAKAAFGIEN